MEIPRGQGARETSMRATAALVRGLLHSFQRRQCDAGGAASAYDAVMDHRARLPERRVVVRELEIARDAGVERRAVVGEHLPAVEPRFHPAVAARAPLRVVDEVVPDV